MLLEDIGKLKYGLDQSLWMNDQQANIGRQLLEVEYNADAYSSGKPLPFNLSIAHKLYRELFGDISRYIIIVFHA